MVDEAGQDEHGLPPARDLRVTETVRESSRLVVGSALLAGRGLAGILARFGTPDGQLGSNKPAESDADGADDADDADEETTTEPDPMATSLTVLSAVRTVMIGVAFDAQRALLRAVDAVTARVAPLASQLGDLPLVVPLRRRLEEQLIRWYARGAFEEAKSRQYAAKALLGVTEQGTDFVIEHLDVDDIRKRLDINDIVESLALDNLILESTGGIAGEAIDAVRAQAVGVDSLIDRFTTKILRRKIQPGPVAARADGDGESTGRES